MDACKVKAVLFILSLLNTIFWILCQVSGQESPNVVEITWLLLMSSQTVPSTRESMGFISWLSLLYDKVRSLNASSGHFSDLIAKTAKYQVIFIGHRMIYFWLPYFNN